jgi:hypothetical protein
MMWLILSVLATILNQRTNAADCALYTVKPQDTCLNIAGSQNATYAQLLAWNSNINI